jgi:hypothetical protein
MRKIDLILLATAAVLFYFYKRPFSKVNTGYTWGGIIEDTPKPFNPATDLSSADLADASDFWFRGE